MKEEIKVVCAPPVRIQFGDIKAMDMHMGRLSQHNGRRNMDETN